ncbi:type II secretion system protein, partial [Acetobacterium wieringae]|uniref:type II secretion system protein n=1 Tax=Acetobacterium wieringae TaxID=52694 RepID=UPI002B1E9A96
VYKSSLGADDHIEQKNKKQGVTQMELINRMRKNRKGFTLVEIIVVLVILAILAAFTIPTMLGFVNDAKGKSYIAEAREVYVAAQSTATEFSAKNQTSDGDLSKALDSTKVKDQATAPATTDADYKSKIVSYQMNKYIGTDLTISANATPTAGTEESAWTVVVGDPKDDTSKAKTTAKVTKLVYLKGGYEVTITGGNATVVKK